MKKLLILVLTLFLIVSSLAGCNSDKRDLGEYNLGMGIEVSYSAEQKDGVNYQATVATVIFDKKGKIVDCKVDCVVPEISIAEGYLEQDAVNSRTFPSKYDMGNNYGMVESGKAKAEWYVQADTFAKYCVGKTSKELADIDLNADNTDLVAGCTIAVNDFIKAVIKACNDDQFVTFTGSDAKASVYATGYVGSNSKDSDNNDGLVELFSDFAAVAVDSNGKLCAAIVDSVQPKFSYNDSGVVTKIDYQDTKRGLKDKYGMNEYGGAISDWFVQARELTNYLVGKTSEEIKASPLDATTGKTTDADLLSVCTIAVSGDINNVVKAMNKIG